MPTRYFNLRNAVKKGWNRRHNLDDFFLLPFVSLRMNAIVVWGEN